MLNVVTAHRLPFSSFISDTSRKNIKDIFKPLLFHNKQGILCFLHGFLHLSSICCISALTSYVSGRRQAARLVAIAMYLSRDLPCKHQKSTLELPNWNLGSISNYISFRIWANCGQFIPCCISLKCMIYYDSNIGHVCPRIMKYLIRYFPSKYGGRGQDSQGRKMLQVILTEIQSIIIPKLLSFPANLIKLPFTGWKLFRWKIKIHGTELQKKAIKKEASNPTDFCRNTNLWNLFGILYPTCIPHKIPAGDGRSISRALQSSCYSAHTQEAIVSLSGKTIFHML